jgi:hypothetical protein
MKLRLSIAVVSALSALWMAVPLASNAGPCRHKVSHDCFKLPPRLDFSSVPDITKKIVGDEPNVRQQRQFETDSQPASEPYTGPMVGVASQVRAPTVGYYWSIH